MFVQDQIAGTLY